VTSGAYCPWLKLYAALALVEKPYSEVGRRLRVENGDALLEAQVAQLPFYSRVKE
jgi:glycine cleavage system aminomethyltransferase T